MIAKYWKSKNHPISKVIVIVTVIVIVIAMSVIIAIAMVIAIAIAIAVAVAVFVIAVDIGYRTIIITATTINSPGHGPIGVLDLVYRPRPCCYVPRPRKVAAPGRSAAKVSGKPSGWMRVNRCQGHGDCICAMDSFDACTIGP